MYIPTRAHFKHLLEMGLGYLHIQRGVCCSSYFDGLMPDASGSGTSNNRAPAFLFIQTNLIAMMESVAMTADGSNLRQY